MLCGIKDTTCQSFARARRVVGSANDAQAGRAADTVVGMKLDQNR